MKKKPQDRATNAASKHTGFEDLITVRVARLAEIFTRLSSYSIGKKWNLRNTDLRLLNVLDQSKKLSIREISRRTHVDKAWVSRTIKELIDRNLVQRNTDPMDSRVKLISLTRHGQKILDQVRPYALTTDKFLLENLDEKLLKDMLDRLEEKGAENLANYK